MQAMNFGGYAELPYGTPVINGDVFTLGGCASVHYEGDCFRSYSDPECTDLIFTGGKDLKETVKLVELLREEGVFDSPYTEGLYTLFLYSYMAELLGEYEEFWRSRESSYRPSVFGTALQYLENTLGIEFSAATSSRSLFAVKSMEDWPVGRAVKPDKVRVEISISGYSVAMVGFSTRGINIEYNAHGSPYRFFLGFKEYSELDTDTIGIYDWYRVCWKRLVCFLLNACGIRSNEFSFFFSSALGNKPFDPYHYNGEGVKPVRVSCMEDLHRVLDDYLEVYRKDKLLYN